MEEIFLYGAGGHAKVVADCVESEGRYKIAGIVDDQPVIESLLGYPVLHSSDIKRAEDKKVIVSIGGSESRKSVAGGLHCTFVSTRHPSAVVSAHASVGAGSQVLAGSVINAGATVGNHCIINTGAVVEHDCNIGDYVHISPNAALGGMVTVGEGSHIGIGASVIQNITIGRSVIVGAGAAVVTDLPDYCTAVGVPARIIKRQET